MPFLILKDKYTLLLPLKLGTVKPTSLAPNPQSTNSLSQTSVATTPQQTALSLQQMETETIQRSTDYGEPSPNNYSYITAPASALKEHHRRGSRETVGENRETVGENSGGWL